MGQNCGFGNCESARLPEAHCWPGQRVAKEGGLENIDRACLIRCKCGSNLDGIYSIMERLKVKRFYQITSSTCHSYGCLFDQMIMSKTTRVNLEVVLS